MAVGSTQGAIFVKDNSLLGADLSGDVTFGTATPPTVAAKDNDTYLVTSDGTPSGMVMEHWKYDAETSTWVNAGVADGVITGGSYDPNVSGGALTLTTSTGGSVVITGLNPGNNLFDSDGQLGGIRAVDMNGNDITWHNGGEFIIDGKLTVTGLIDPTGMQFSGPQADVSMPNETIYITDGSSSGHPAGEFIFKDASGNYHALQSAGGDSLYSADGALAANRVVSGSDRSLTFNNLSRLTIDTAISSFPGFYGNADFTVGRLEIDAIGSPGNQGKLDVQGGSFLLSTNSGGQEGEITFSAGALVSKIRFYSGW